MQQPEQPQQPQQAAPSPWPDLCELGAKLFLSPIPSPSIAQVLPLGADTSPPCQSSLQTAGLLQSNQPPPVAPIPMQESEAGFQDNYAAKATEFLTRIQEVLHIEDIRTELTQGNYKEKMHKLLCWEEKAHIEILGNK